MIVSLVIPGNTRSYKRGVIIYLAPVFGSLNTKNTFEVPTYPILPLKRYRTCWYPLRLASFATVIVGP